MITIKEGAQETHTFSVLVDNEAGVLARVRGLFSGRGYNIESLVPVHKVTDLTIEGPSVEREMALIKVLYSSETKDEILRLCEIYRAKIVDTTENSFVFELTGAMDKINSFIDLLRPLGLNDISRTGLAAILRGSKE